MMVMVTNQKKKDTEKPSISDGFWWVLWYLAEVSLLTCINGVIAVCVCVCGVCVCGVCVCVYVCVWGKGVCVCV
jgi:hypothetical protein